MPQEPRKDPKSCREQDLGRFEILHDCGRARLGKLHTAHGPLHTPALLPVINPNIRTIEPKEMWQRWGIEGLITNSYIIWKHEELNKKARENGVHQLIDYPGVIVCDSGTFQSYVYGDVEVGVEEIVEFQKDIGVDIATMLDVFTRPDMNRTQVEKAVDDTSERAPASVRASGDMMLNGPVQGGLYWDLRRKSAIDMAKHDFAVHPIGGIVPIMEQQNYVELSKVMLSAIPELPIERPVHLFGCGHPMLFPMAVALGADLFDSAAYALFARDDRLLTPWGTVKLQDLEHWPVTSPTLFGITPQEVRELDDDARCKLLARHNLDVSIAELDRCRQAVKDGTIWELVQMRSHQHPALKEAYDWIMKVLTENTEWSKASRWLLEASPLQKNGGLKWFGNQGLERPDITSPILRLQQRWRPAARSRRALILYGRSGPWRDTVGDKVSSLRISAEDLEVFIHTPMGLLPWSLEDLNPFAHILEDSGLHKQKPERETCLNELHSMNFQTEEVFFLDISKKEKVAEKLSVIFSELKELDANDISKGKYLLEQEQAIAKLAFFADLEPRIAAVELEGCSFVHSNTGRVKNIILNDGRHVASPRLTDGGMSLTAKGASWLHSLREVEFPSGFESNSESHQGPPWVVIDSDAVPFVKQGRNVFHGFIKAADGWLRNGMYCLVVDEDGILVGHGKAMSTISGMQRLRKGIAVKVRNGID